MGVINMITYINFLMLRNMIILILKWES